LAEKSQNGALVKYSFMSDSLWTKSVGDDSFTVTSLGTPMFTLLISHIAVYPVMILLCSNLAIRFPSPLSEILIPSSDNFFVISLDDCLPFAISMFRIFF